MAVDPALLAVALVVRSKDGPRFVFHYPPRLVSNESKELPRYGTELDPTSPDPSDEEDNSDDDLDDGSYNLNGKFDQLEFGKKERHVSQWHGDDHFEIDGRQIVPWEHIDVHSTKDLASILTPARSYHKKMFELTLDPLLFITYPMHIREDGRWKKKRKDKKRRRRKDEEDLTIADETVMTESPIDVTPPEKEEDKVSPDKGSSFNSDDADPGGMTMFNLVFIMHPLPEEASVRTLDMFEHVAKDLNKAMRYAQNYNNYIWKESEMILGMKDKAREERRPMNLLWESILEKSSLARAIETTYKEISSGRIALVQLMSEPPVRLSVQIPIPHYASMPPDMDEKAMPNLWITTSISLTDQDGEENSVLSKHFALLLMDEEETIVADVQTDGGELTAPILEYLKIVKPTLSFNQTAQQHNISLSDIRMLAQHLILYQRARAIPPLHVRDTYILSPNSNHHLLASLSNSWRSTFPLVPPLPNFLSTISLAPRPYKSFIPSKTHRPLYIDMLAFLVRHGILTRLQTYARVIAWPEIKYEVQYELDGKRIRAAYADAQQDAVDDSRSNATDSVPPTSEAQAEKARLHRLRAKAQQDLEDFKARPLPVATATPNMNSASHVVRLQPQLILDPAKAEHVDSLYLAAISRRFGEREGKLFLKWAKYFDGRTPLESVALLEGMKRKEAWNTLVGFEEFLLTVRHW